MKLFGLLLLVGLAFSAPTSKEDDKLVITDEFFPDELAVYTSQYDIVNVFVPLNALNFEEDAEDDDTNDDSGTTLFFVEADVKEDGTKDYKGLYVLKEGKATKLLDNGRDSTATSDESKVAYFGATDGLYTYNHETNTADKYGSVTDNIISLAKENGTDAIYILTEDKHLYKVTDDGNKKVKIDNVPNAEQIVLDYSNNLYYYDADKKLYVVSVDGVKQIDGLPENPTEVTLLRPPFIIEDGVVTVVNDKAYVVYVNGTSEVTDFEFRVKPTAYSAEATLIQYYAYKKKIYEYNILALVLGSLLEELKEFLDDKKEVISAIATRSRNDLRPGA